MSGARLADQAYSGIVEFITARGLCVGDRLPSELQLAEIFDVSRTIIREALVRLAADGITQSTEPPDGVDYKFKKIDTIDHYESFLRGPIAGEPRDVVLAAGKGTRMKSGRAKVLHEVAGGWQLRSSPDNSAFARRFLKVKPQRLTRAALETLAIIAYRQPITGPEIQDLRGKSAVTVLKNLLERRLIRIVGRKEVVGRPMLYGTTKDFLEFFNLKDLKDLPTLREFYELNEESMAKIRELDEQRLAEAREKASPKREGEPVTS